MISDDYLIVITLSLLSVILVTFLVRQDAVLDLLQPNFHPTAKKRLRPWFNLRLVIPAVVLLQFLLESLDGADHLRVLLLFPRVCKRRLQLVLLLLRRNVMI